MRRGLAALLMIVTVLAPCAIAHAMQSQTAGIASAQHHLVVSPAREYAHHEHTRDDAHNNGHCGNGETNHTPLSEDCSGDCQTLQRVAAFTMPDRARSAVDVEFDSETLVSLISQAHSFVSTVHHSQARFEHTVARIDTVSVLHQTARFRL